MEWKPIETVPDDGRVFWGKAYGMVALCTVRTETDRFKSVRDWPKFWKRKQVRDRKGGKFFAFALPSESGYYTLGMRRDLGWTPTEWAEYDFLPPEQLPDNPHKEGPESA